MAEKEQSMLLHSAIIAGLNIKKEIEREIEKNHYYYAHLIY